MGGRQTSLNPPNHTLRKTNSPQPQQYKLPAHCIKSFPKTNLESTSRSPPNMIITHQLLSQQNIIRNPPTWDKSGLRTPNNTRKDLLKPIHNDLGNAFIKDIATRYRPKVTHTQRALHLRNQSNACSTNTSRQLISGKEMTNSRYDIKTNNVLSPLKK